MRSLPDIRIQSTLRFSVNAASMTAAGIGIAVMLGWIFDIQFLKSIIPTAATMKFNTAAGFLLAGTSLWLLKNEESRPRKKRAGQILAGLVAVIGILTLSEYLFHWQLGIDQIFISDLAASDDAFPGRMSGITAVCFTFSGLALMLIDTKVSQYFSISVILFSLLAVIGYLFEFHSLYRLGGYGSVALHTGIAFLILSLAVLAARPARGVMEVTTSELEGGRAVRLLLPFSTLFIILLGWLVERGERLGFLDSQNSVVILIVLLIVIYSPLIFSYARKINKSEERFVKAFHASPVGLVITRRSDATYLDANESYLQMFGFSRDELIGHTPIELNIISPEERARLSDQFRGQGKVRNFEIQSRTKSGRLITTLFSTEQIELGGEPCNIVTTIDITERKQAEAKIQHHLQRLTGLQRIDRAISSSFDIRTTLEIVLQEVDSQLGVDASAILLINSHDQTMEYAASRGFLSHILNRIKLDLGESHASRALRERRTIHIPDLSIFGGQLSEAIQRSGEGFVDYYGTPLIAKDKIEGVLEVYNRSPIIAGTEWSDLLNTLAGQAAIAIDNSRLWERIQLHTSELEQHVEDRTAQLNLTNLELEHANRAKDDFLASMSHELRTPLNSILGLSEALLEQRRDPLSEYQQRALQTIESSGRHLLDLINDILDLSKIEAGMFDYYPQAVEADQLCRASLAFVREQAVRKSVKLIYEEGKFNSKVYVDPRRVKQILVNLLINGVKFTPEGGKVTLRVEGDADRDLVRFSVIDNGIGISPEDLRRLFQPFVQVDSRLNRRFEGTGLGLALVQKLTELHGGSISVESNVGEGSRFTVKLPWGRMSISREESGRSGGALPTPHEPEETIPYEEEPVYRGMVLLAEDNTANVLTISEYLESHGYEITVAHDGLEALEKAEEINPNIILMDIQMPVLDGLEAIRRLRADPRFNVTPIIALTALAMPGDRELCLEAGANEYLSKPVSLSTLSKTIKKMLERHA